MSEKPERTLSSTSRMGDEHRPQWIDDWLEDGVLRHTELHSWHVEQGGRMVPFAGFEMPVQYRTGIIGEHLATRR